MRRSRRSRRDGVVFAVFLRAGVVAARWCGSSHGARRCTHAGRARGVLTTMFECSGATAWLDLRSCWLGAGFAVVRFGSDATLTRVLADYIALQLPDHLCLSCDNPVD